MNKHRVIALIIKEFNQLYRDPSSIIMAVVMPLILLFLFGFGISLDMDNMKVAVVMQDRSALARSFVRSIEYTKSLSIEQFSSTQAAEVAISKGDIGGFIIIPAYFSQRFYDSSEPAPIQVITDGTQPNTAAFLQNYIKVVWKRWKALNKKNSFQQPKVGVTSRIWYNQKILSTYYLIPGSIAIIMTIIGSLLTSLVISREWERGTMEGLLSTRVEMKEIIIAKLITYAILAIGALFVCYFVAHFIFNIPMKGSYLAFFLSSGAFLSYALAMGLLISIIIRDQFAASQIALITTYLPAFILSGFIFDISSMPYYLRVITNFIPAKYYVSNLKTIFLVGDVWPVLIPNIFYTLCFAAVVSGFIGRNCSRSMD